MSTKHLQAIEWEELLQLLSRFAGSAEVEKVKIKNNQPAHAMGMVPADHVSLDIFVWYVSADPSLAVQRDIIRGFIGDTGLVKVWDGLNVANLWKEPNARHYTCLLFWPPENNQTSQAHELKKIGFLSSDGPGVLGYQSSYTWSTLD